MKRERDLKWVALGEVAMYSKTRVLANSITSKTYVGVDNLLQNRQGKKNSGYVPIEGALTEYKVGDILLGNIRPYLKKIWQATNDGGANGDVLVVRINEDSRDMIKSDYIYHLLSSDRFFDYSMRNSKGAKMPRGDKSAILKYTIPIPPLSQQERIVAILDRFDRLVNSISSGLPAEITARRQQYEYYRTKLLTFKELSV
jgi:type I restriction enzyme S subunit